jgi:hypothetical protein
MQQVKISLARVKLDKWIRTGSPRKMGVRFNMNMVLLLDLFSYLRIKKTILSGFKYREFIR